MQDTTCNGPRSVLDDVVPSVFNRLPVTGEGKPRCEPVGAAAQTEPRSPSVAIVHSVRNALFAAGIMSLVGPSLAGEPSAQQVREWQKTVEHRKALREARQQAIQRDAAAMELAQAQAILLNAAVQARQNEAIMGDALAEAWARLAILQSGFAYNYEYYPANDFGAYYYVYYPNPDRPLDRRECLDEIARERDKIQLIKDLVRQLGIIRAELALLLSERQNAPNDRNRQTVGHRGGAAHVAQGHPSAPQQTTLAMLHSRIEQVNQLARNVNALNLQVAAQPIFTAQRGIQQTMVQHAATIRATVAAQANGFWHPGGGHPGGIVGGHFGGGSVGAMGGGHFGAGGHGGGHR